MRLFNKRIHDNLLALGYRYMGRHDIDNEVLDIYDHPDNDDWMSIDVFGHIDFLDYCEYTEGSKKGRASRIEWERTRAQIALRNNSGNSKTTKH
jgi:hypothetical protein